MKISYCRDCTPTKPAIAVGEHDSVDSHEAGGDTHTDIGSIDVDDDPRGAETIQEYLDRLTTAHQASFT